MSTCKLWICKDSWQTLNNLPQGKTKRLETFARTLPFFLVVVLVRSLQPRSFILWETEQQLPSADGLLRLLLLATLQPVPFSLPPSSSQSIDQSALERGKLFQAWVCGGLSVCPGLCLVLTPSWWGQEVETLLDSLFLKRINLLLKDLSAGNCEVGEGLYLSQNWSFRVHSVTWSFIYILCTFSQGEEDACGTMTSLNVAWSSDYLTGQPVRDFCVQLLGTLL